ncbi:MAG: hypothetical protein KJZ73_06815 [Pseudorhodoplanes sp.]|nr:hypothetical protein [Pseudorhodoplanes sp.]MBW7949979.1 hypothetical protein [Pseudorhodoplanes sp.]MCL4710944.1 hypothetical protein [Pseudorhodoplanes sp.]GIK80384.1 MAG: hypothetical protein BroJett024_14890 [Alphaproteobacteria bacterium]
MSNRLAAFLASIAVLGATAFLYFAAPTRSGEAKNVLLLYVGAEDCSPCRKWQKDDGENFRSTTEFSRITYREVKAPTLFELLKDDYWPHDLRSYRDQLGRGTGVPLWIVVSNGVIVEQSSGASKWRAAVLPKIRSLLR